VHHSGRIFGIGGDDEDSVRGDAVRRRASIHVSLAEARAAASAAVGFSSLRQLVVETRFWLGVASGAVDAGSSRGSVGRLRRKSLSAAAKARVTERESPCATAASSEAGG